MIHSASLRATGSVIALSAWVASAALCLRTSSMTFSSVSMSALEVDDVAAIAAGVVGLRGTGGAAARRVADGGAGEGARVVTEVLAPACSFGASLTLLPAAALS